MRQEQALQAARDEKLVSTKDRVKIGKSNLRIDLTLTQNEETYQVILYIIITVDVPKIYMQQFWFTIKKVQKSSFYQFVIDNKTCQIDVELFREILYIFPKVQNQEFIVPPSHDSLMEFLLELGYKGQLRYISKIYIDKCKIKNSEAYKTFIGISTSLIPLKKGRGKVAQETKVVDIPKKPTADSKKKRLKKNVSIRDEFTHLEIDTQKAIKASRHESIFQHQSDGSSEGVGLRPEVPDEPTKKSADSDEGDGTSPKVPNESKEKSKARDDLKDWGFTDDEEYLLTYKDENLKEIPWYSTNEDESDNDDDDDDETKDDDKEDEPDNDESINIEKTNDERTDTDTVMGKAKKVVEQKVYDDVQLIYGRMVDVEVAE
nr:hypothetical protein [Tanacetum cinerariifolium]